MLLETHKFAGRYVGIVDDKGKEYGVSEVSNDSIFKPVSWKSFEESVLLHPNLLLNKRTDTQIDKTFRGMNCILSYIQKLLAHISLYEQ
jgi:hypothetical protein